MVRLVPYPVVVRARGVDVLHERYELHLVIIDEMLLYEVAIDVRYFRGLSVVGVH